jgi:hypothetical protein
MLELSKNWALVLTLAPLMERVTDSDLAGHVMFEPACVVK